MQNKNVLIIEDDEVVQHLIKVMVEKRGASATVAASSRDVTNLLREPARRFNLIFLDLILPKGTGWDILEILKSNLQTRDTPVIILTGATLSAKEQEKMLQKASAVIEKNKFTLSAFNEVIDQWL